MNLKLTNGNGGELQLSTNFKMTISPFVRRTGVRDRYGKDGGKSMGDGRANARTINFSYDNRQGTGTRSEKDAAYRAQLNAITGFFDPSNEPWELHDLTGGIKTEVIMQDNADEPKQPGLEYILGKNDLSLIMLSAHWEDEEGIIFSQTGVLQSGDTFTLNNDSLFFCWPIFIFTSLNNNTEFSLTNTTTDETFTLGNAANTVGAVFTVNGRDGTIDLSGVESSISLADGSGFISLAPGINDFLYESSVDGECLIEVKYKRRYAH